jgi:hypothetical protein
MNHFVDPLPIRRALPLTSILPLLLALLLFGCQEPEKPLVQVGNHSSIALIGNNLGSRMLHYGSFETEMHLRFPKDSLTIRNMCDGGDTPGFRAHSARNTPWAFPGAEKFQTELATNSASEGFFDYPDAWLTRVKADVILGFFGANEAYNGAEGLDNFKEELRAFIVHTLQQRYNGESAPQLVLVSPIAFEDLSASHDLPNGKTENENLAMYTKAMEEVCLQEGVPFINAFDPSMEWFSSPSP